jgi:hypothetical protein
MPSTPSHDWFLPARDELLQALYAHYQQAVQDTMAAEGLEGWDLNLAQVAYTGGDAPIQPADGQRHIPYSDASFFAERLAGAAERGFFEAAEDGYRLSEHGRAVVERLQGAIVGALAAVPVDPATAETVTGHLQTQIAGCLDCDFDIPNLRYSRRFDPGADAPVLQRLRRALNDLNAFRDDAHVAAFRALDVPAHEWEAFSHVWGEQVWGDPVNTVDEVADKLGFRGHGKDVYREALESAVGRGWLAHEGKRYVVTEEGRRMREAAEADTNARYFAGWRLEEDEAAELKREIDALAKQLRASAPQPEAAGS